MLKRPLVPATWRNLRFVVWAVTLASVGYAAFIISLYPPDAVYGDLRPTFFLRLAIWAILLYSGNLWLFRWIADSKSRSPEHPIDCGAISSWVALGIVMPNLLLEYNEANPHSDLGFGMIGGLYFFFPPNWLIYYLGLRLLFSAKPPSDGSASPP
jgi:hypothetical protein